MPTPAPAPPLYADHQPDISGHGMLYMLLQEHMRRRPFYRRLDMLMLLAVLLVFLSGFIYGRLILSFLLYAWLALPFGVLFVAYHKTARILENGFLFHMLMTPQSFRSLFEDLRDHILDSALPAMYILILFPMHALIAASPRTNF